MLSVLVRLVLPLRHGESAMVKAESVLAFRLLRTRCFPCRRIACASIEALSKGHALQSSMVKELAVVDTARAAVRHGERALFHASIV